MIRPRYYIYGFDNSIEVCSNFNYYKVRSNSQLLSVRQPVMAAPIHLIPDLAVILTHGSLPFL